MKKTLFIILFLASASVVFAQNNLEYNKTHTFEVELLLLPAQSPIYFKDSISINVPVNKTLKIESVICGSLNQNNGILGSEGALYLGNSLLLQNSYMAQLPFWLESGDYAFILQGATNSSSSILCECKISALEFNITQ